MNAQVLQAQQIFQSRLVHHFFIASDSCKNWLLLLHLAYTIQIFHSSSSPDWNWVASLRGKSVLPLFCIFSTKQSCIALSAPVTYLSIHPISIAQCASPVDCNVTVFVFPPLESPSPHSSRNTYISFDIFSKRLHGNLNNHYVRIWIQLLAIPTRLLFLWKSHCNSFQSNIQPCQPSRWPMQTKFPSFPSVEYWMKPF